MTPSAAFLSPSEAAARLGVSTKALRLYEQRGLVAPLRTAAGWRTYGPDQIARAAEIAALRALGLSLSEIGRVLAGDPKGLEPALAAHQARLEARQRDLAAMVASVRELRATLAAGKAPASGAITDVLRPSSGLPVAFDLPWPWGGERFELEGVAALTLIVGPLGSGKTRLAMRLAEAIPGAVFLGLERASADACALARQKLRDDPLLRRRYETALAWLLEDGATRSDALVALLAALVAEAPAAIVVDMVEQGLDEATQHALIAHLRQSASPERPLFLMTRSSAILDPEAMRADEPILFCPANHRPPVRIAPYPGSPGLEAVASCLAAPDVRARTEGTIAWRPQAAG